MKTEPTKALGWLRRRKSFCNHMSMIEFLYAELACKTAFEEGQQSPRIRQLEWVKEGDVYVCRNPLYKAIIIIDFDASYILKSNISKDHPYTSYYDNLKEAKDAAQADFYERIKQCIE